MVLKQQMVNSVLRFMAENNFDIYVPQPIPFFFTFINFKTRSKKLEYNHKFRNFILDSSLFIYLFLPYFVLSKYNSLKIIPFFILSNTKVYLKKNFTYT